MPPKTQRMALTASMAPIHAFSIADNGEIILFGTAGSSTTPGELFFSALVCIEGFGLSVNISLIWVVLFIN